jgi:hypothetical protein
MDLKDLFFLTNHKNILEKHNLSHTFFTEPHKILDEDVCLEQIIRIISHHRNNLKFPFDDSSDVFDMLQGKEKFSNSFQFTIEKKIRAPYIKQTNDEFVNLICFMKAYASHTYSYKGSFKEYFKDVFNVFYNI